MILTIREGTKLKISPKQWKALTKRVADITEKLSVGAFLYWICQNETSGIWWGLEFLAISLIITIAEAKEWTGSQSTASSER